MTVARICGRTHPTRQSHTRPMRSDEIDAGCDHPGGDHFTRERMFEVHRDRQAEEDSYDRRPFGKRPQHRPGRRLRICDPSVEIRRAHQLRSHKPGHEHEREIAGGHRLMSEHHRCDQREYDDDRIDPGLEQQHAARVEGAGSNTARERGRERRTGIAGRRELGRHLPKQIVGSARHSDHSSLECAAMMPT